MKKKITSKKRIERLLKTLWLKIGEKYSGRLWIVKRVSSTTFVVLNNKTKKVYECEYDEFNNKWFIEHVKG